tara:strand:- start:987 stop:1115 length:129 start_codon:yes stop_codon:yes gene_type:complete
MYSSSLGGGAAAPPSSKRDPYLSTKRKGMFRSQEKNAKERKN